MTVEAYCNLTRRCWPIREGGRVVGHVASLALRDVRLVVSAAGCARVRQRRQREVVAFARGGRIESDALHAGALQVRFDPFAAPAFTLPDGTPVSTAALLFLDADGAAWAVLET